MAASAERGISATRTALWRFFNRHRISRKKKHLQAAEQKREELARQRQRWIREQGFLDPARLVFVDETAPPPPWFGFTAAARAANAWSAMRRKGIGKP